MGSADPVVKAIYFFTMKSYNKLCFVGLLLFLISVSSVAIAQVPIMKIQDAIQIALTHYKTIDARKNYAEASKSAVSAVRSQYLPDLNMGAQTAYGTINGINGPNYGLPGVSTINGGVVSPTQNWNAAFGSLYVANINWQFFAFGSQKANVKVAQGQYQNDLDALGEENFQVQANVSGAYLNLLSAQRLSLSMQKNLDRATTLRNLILTRTINGLNPGVDSAIANAELSKARLSLLDAQNYQQTQANQLMVLLGDHQPLITLDTSFVTHQPNDLGLEQKTAGLQHPMLKYLDSRTKVSELQANAINTSKWPKFSFFTLYQGRGSGFGSDYATGTNSVINHSLSAGLDPVRTNYMLGISAVWNLTDLIRTKKRVTTQNYLTTAYQDEYEVQQSALQDQLSLADQRILIAIKQYNEAPLQLKSAGDAYLQKSSLYQNGLATIVDVTQALYNLNRAETDHDLAYNSLWQALLYKAATAGDLNLFLSQIH
ncbi:MAG: transporter [Mucilaginibacter sp.]|nr:transporter [Mucilaginibacter sp.]